MNLLQIQGLTKIYRRGSEEIHALRGIDLTARAGEFISIVGPSGSGKTALMNLIGSLDTPDKGTIHIHGKEITALTEGRTGFYPPAYNRFCIPAVLPDPDDDSP